MLYDNAQLAVCYLHGWQVIGKERYREVAEQTVDYMLRELALDGGGLRLGAGRRHRRRRGADVHLDARRTACRTSCLHIFEGGRFILRGELDERAARASSSSCASSGRKPARDDKAIASWNGLALAALAECGRVLDRADWIDAARRLGEFLLGPLSTEGGRLHRTWRDGVAKGTGYLEDYADVANGLYELHVATGELRWLEEANRLARLAVELFGDDENGGFFQTPADGEQLVVAQEGLRRPPGAERQLDARLRAAAARAHLRRRRARGAGGRRVFRLIPAR